MSSCGVEGTGWGSSRPGDADVTVASQPQSAVLIPPLVADAAPCRDPPQSVYCSKAAAGDGRVRAGKRQVSETATEVYWLLVVSEEG